MPAITITDLENAKTDVDHLAAIANSTALTATDRLGRTKQTIAGLSAEFPNASANAAAAAASATQAANEAASAATAVDLAFAEATAAQTARNGAEAARDAAMLSAGVYATTAAGLAATVSGRYFSVPSADSTEYLILYLNNAGAAVEKKRYPSSAVVSGLTPYWESSKFIQGLYIDASGNVYSSSSYGMTDYLLIEGNKQYSIAAFLIGGVSHAWYDANKTLINTFQPVKSSNSPFIVASPSNARFLRSSVTFSQVSSAKIFAVDVLFNAEKIKALIDAHPPQMGFVAYLKMPNEVVSVLR